jgi:hypothetical protein
MRAGAEGIVSKAAHASYRGGRDPSWLKIKCRGQQSTQRQSEGGTSEATTPTPMIADRPAAADTEAEADPARQEKPTAAKTGGGL